MRASLAQSLRERLYAPVVLPCCCLVLVGLLVLWSAGKGGGPLPIDDWHVRQLTAVAVGLVVGAVLLLVPFKRLVAHAYLLYWVNVFLLVLVLLVAPLRKGTQRWINLLGFDLQPSEYMKLTLVVTLARYIRFRSSYKTFKGLGAPFLLTLLPMALVLKQPDLGTAILLIPILFTMLFVAGARLRHLATIVLLGALAMVPVYTLGLQPYQKERIQAFVRQLPGVPEAVDEHHAASSGYQLLRSKAAVGSGGVFGVGLGSAGENAAGQVPERHTDFIFAVLAHEWGLFGGVVLLALWTLVLVAILQVALRQRDPAGRLLCVGVFALFGAQAFINIAMTVGLMPVTGLTLPFVSYGRSSLVVSLAAVALVCNVATRPSYEFGRGDFR
ncbi:MAG: rod shape-determining protein RodA [Planctomycetota bacterium]